MGCLQVLIYEEDYISTFIPGTRLSCRKSQWCGV